LNKSLPYRIFWQVFLFSAAAKKMCCDILFIPGGSFTTCFRPTVTISQNLLPFESMELFRFGWSFKTIKLLLLRYTQIRSFKHASGVIFLTKYAENAVRKITGALSGPTAIIPHGLDARFFAAPKLQKQINQYSAENPLRILYVSIIDVYKHQWHVADAVAQLRRQGFPVCLDLVGPAYPPALKYLQGVLNEHDPLTQFLKYLGPVSYKELHAHYAASDIFIFASSCENLPNILLEAMASGLPVACSKLGPMPEVLGDAGLYFDPESPTSIADALHQLINSPELRLEKATKAYELAQQYSWERCAQETFQFLNKIARVKSV
jgi:glycosyltransferase involved in cell wall biosynthesis